MNIFFHFPQKKKKRKCKKELILSSFLICSLLVQQKRVEKSGMVLSPEEGKEGKTLGRLDDYENKALERPCLKAVERLDEGGRTPR